MALKTKTWKKEEAAVKNAKSSLRSIKEKYAKTIQKEKTLSSTMDANKATVAAIEKDQNYYWKTDKKTKKKHLVKRKKPKTLSKEEAKKLADAQSGYAKAKAERGKVLSSNTYKHAKSKVSKASKKLNSAKTKLNNYIKKVHKANAKQVKKAESKNYRLFMAPHASLHRTDNASTKQIFMFATSEDETNDDDVTSYAIDTGAPTADHIKRSGKTITLTAYLYAPNSINHLWGKGKKLPGESRKSIDQQYTDLLEWNRHGVELTYKSDNSTPTKKGMNHMYFKHVYITSLGKLLDAPYKDMMQLSITLTYLYRAKVKTTGNSKGKKSKQGHYVGANVISLNHGQTAAQLAKKFHTTTKAIENMNHGQYAFSQGTKVKVSPGLKAVKTKTQTKYTGFTKNNLTSSKVQKIMKRFIEGK